MPTHDSEEKFYLLATRVITGEATKKEREDLQDVLIQDQSFRDRFQRLQEGWNREPSTASDTSFLFEVDPALEKMWDSIQERSEDNTTTFHTSSSESVIPHSGQKRQSKVVNHRQIRARHRFRRSRILMVAAILLCAIGMAYAAYFLWEQPVEAIYATSEVEQRIISLPDHSTVRLNHNSRVEIQFNETSGERLVHLEGEAFFDVRHDPGRPFRVRVGDSEVRVHGTSFNVKNRERLLVAVRDGVVSVHDERLHVQEGIRLHAGQLGMLAAEGKDFRIEDGNIENYLGWVNGYLNFDDMPFPLVVKQLERIFGVESELVDPGLQEIRLSVYADRMQLSEVLQTIAMTLDLSYEMEGQRVRWKFDRS